MKTNNTKILVIIPAYNEEKGLNIILERINNKYNVLVIDDGSADKTVYIAKKWGAKVISHQQNKGNSIAIRTGIKYAYQNGYKKVIIMDGDGQHDPRYIDQFVSLLSTNDIVFGNRIYSDSNMPSLKFASNILGSLVVKEITGIYVSDISCGFKGITLNKKIIEIANEASSYTFVFDLLFYVVSHNIDFAYVEVDAIYHYDSLLYTSKKELISFFIALNRFADNLKKVIPENIRYLEENISNSNDFSISIYDMEFWGFYLPKEDGYILQVEPNRIKNFLKSIQ